MKNTSLEASFDKHYETIDKIILSRQDPITGLLPASTAVNAHGDYTDAWVRDNVYSILGVWGLALSYRKYQPNHHRSHLLSQSVVKLMRGLLLAMMRQSDRVETFKNTLKPTDALHAKYGTNTGLAVVGDDEWGHLQLDASSLFLLMLAQMSASGLSIIYTMDEVNFIQNMVHYISRTYCTPDYGIWERGNKINHGTTEINASSVGMAKAALEALDGFNLFGNITSQEAVIHVVTSDIARSSFTLEGLLPRESISKETDAALLSIIGYPAYAVEDEELCKKTRDKVIKKLAGNYGCKRFLLDGHQSSIEDETRLHYEPSELREFEHIESEWPLFFTYLLLDALMRNDTTEIKHWHNKLLPLFVEKKGLHLLPELYIVPVESIDAEKAEPHSQVRVPNENLPLVWAQSLFILSDMMMDGILEPSDIDPLNRHKRIGHKRGSLPLVPLLAENNAVQQQLLALGIKSESLQELNSIRIMHSIELSHVHTMLGKNEKLALSGRPLQVARAITTSRLYLIEDEKIIFLPYYFNPRGFYLSYDNKLLVEHFKGSLKFLSRYWDKSAQPLMPFLIREDMLLDSARENILELLHELDKGVCNDISIQTGKLQTLLYKADVEHIAYVHNFKLHDIVVSHETSTGHISCPIEDIPLNLEQLQSLQSAEDDFLIDTLINSQNRRIQTYALALLWQKKGQDFEVQCHEKNSSLAEIAEKYYERATLCHEWAVIRHIADFTKKHDDRLEDVLLDVVIRQKRLAVGRAYSEKATFSKPHKSSDIVEIIFEFCGNSTAEGALTQEIVLHLGHMIRMEPELFKDILTLRTWSFVQLLVGQISREKSLSIAEAYEHLLYLPPHDIFDRLRSVLTSFKRENSQLVKQENLLASGISSFKAIMLSPFATASVEVDDWAKWREHVSVTGGLPSNFYKDVWHLLQQCNALVIGDKYNLQNRISSDETLDATAGERSFALKIDTLLQSIDALDYRQLNIEAIESLACVFGQSPELHVDNDLVLDILIGHAVRISWERDHTSGDYNEQRALAWENIYKLSPKELDKAFVEAFRYLLTPDNFEDIG